MLYCNKYGYYSHNCWYKNNNKNKYRSTNKRKYIKSKWNSNSKNKNFHNNHIENNYTESILNHDYTLSDDIQLNSWEMSNKIIKNKNPFNNNISNWILDSCFSIHIYSDLKLLINIKSCHEIISQAR